MSKDYSAIALFCEDIRLEASGQNSIVGILPDNVNVLKIPEVIPKLGVYVRIHLFNYDDPPSILFRLVGDEEQEFLKNYVEDHITEKAISESRQSNIGYAGIVSHVLASPFQIQQTGLIRALVAVDGDEQLAGAIRIIKEE